MDPISIIVAALVAGAAAGLKPTAEQVIKDAYTGLKSLLQRKYKAVAVEALEHKPESKAKQESVAEDLAEAGADQDNELLDQAKALLDTIKTHEPQAAVAVGVDLEKIEAEYVALKKISATGTGVKVGSGKYAVALLSRRSTREAPQKSRSGSRLSLCCCHR